MEPLIARPSAQPFLLHSVTHFTDLVYAIWFVFAPIPLHSLAASIDISTLTSRCCVRLPEYLSLKSRCSIYAIALSTHVSFYASIGLFIATFLVGKFVLLQHRASAPIDRHVHHLYDWVRLALALLVARTVIRYFIKWDLQNRREVRLSFADKARIEYYVDLVFWSSFMILCTARLRLFMVVDDAPEMLSHGSLSKVEVNVFTALMWVFINSWIADIVLRFLWLGIHLILEADFESSHVHRLISVLPAVTILQECSICLNEGSDEKLSLPCGHAFHKCCLVSWARTCHHGLGGSGISCPLCRDELHFSIDDWGQVCMSAPHSRSSFTTGSPALTPAPDPALDLTPATDPTPPATPTLTPAPAPEALMG